MYTVCVCVCVCICVCICICICMYIYNSITFILFFKTNQCTFCGEVDIYILYIDIWIYVDVKAVQASGFSKSECSVKLRISCSSLCSSLNNYWQCSHQKWPYAL